MTMALRCLAFACGGEEGVRLADRLGMATSPGTLLRELRRPELPVRARPKAFPLPLFFRTAAQPTSATLSAR